MGAHRSAGIGCALIAAAVLAGCSSGGSSSSGSPAAPTASGSSGAANGLMSAADAAAVHQRVLALEKRPTSIGITEKVKSIPPGKTIYYVSTNNPAGVQTVAAIKQAVAALGHGWQVKDLEVNPTPQGFQSAIDLAISDHATSIVLPSVTEAQITKQLEQAKAAGIPVFNLDSVTPTDSLMTDLIGPQALLAAGQDEADYILDKTGGKVTPLIMPLDGIAATSLLVTGFDGEWKKMCPACSTPQTLSVQYTSLGSNMPSLVTAYLASHRNVSFLVPAIGDMVPGLPQALKAGGFGSLRAVTYAQSPQNDPLMVAGTFLDAEMGGTIYENPWAAVDATLRILNGQSTVQDQDLAGPNSPVQWIITGPGLTSNGINPDSYYPLVANYQAQFEALWGLN
jgi:ribose transport system substrate-binding protein